MSSLDSDPNFIGGVKYSTSFASVFTINTKRYWLIRSRHSLLLRIGIGLVLLRRIGFRYHDNIKTESRIQGNLPDVKSGRAMLLAPQH